jgi:HPr kinase/phosphorylase
VLGKPEILYYQRLDDEPRKRQMGELILLEPPFLVVADGMEPPPDLELRCTRSSTPLFTTPVSSAAVIDHLRLYLSRISAPRVTMHGVFLDILGMGVLIMGESGLGKSELGLELISRGHGLVADDAVDFVRLGPISSKAAARRCCRTCSKCAAWACSTSRRSSVKRRCAGR